MKKSRLLIILFGQAVALTANAVDTCSEVLHFDKMSRRISESLHIDVVKNSSLLSSQSFIGVYDRDRRSIILSELLALPASKFVLFHETVHAYTELRIRTNYSLEYGARGIIFQKRDGAAINSILPPAYRNYFVNDEIVAYEKSAEYSKNLIQDFSQLSPPDDQRDFSLRFKNASNQILGELSEAIKNSDFFLPKGYDLKIFNYSSDAPNVRFFVYYVPRADGIIEIAIPVQVPKDFYPVLGKKLHQMALNVMAKSILQNSR